MPDDLPLPLTIPVHAIVMAAFEELESMDREESYLLERLKRVPESERKAELLKAIEDAPDD